MLISILNWLNVMLADFLRTVIQICSRWHRHRVVELVDVGGAPATPVALVVGTELAGDSCGRHGEVVAAFQVGGVVLNTRSIILFTVKGVFWVQPKVLFMHRLLRVKLGVLLLLIEEFCPLEHHRLGLRLRELDGGDLLVRDCN